MRPGMDRGEREQMIETYRALRTGAIVLAALYLRHGDALAASKALQGGEIQRAMPREFAERLEAAASTNDPAAWRELAGLYASADTNTTNPEVAIAPEIARGAAWGSLLEAYRASPNSIELALPLAGMAQGLGMPDVTTPIIFPAVRDAKSPKAVEGGLMVLLKTLADEDHAHDPLSARRVFNASQPLMAMADSLSQTATLDPSPAQIRLAMGSIEVRAGEVARGRPLLEAALAKEPSIAGYLSLASVLNQAGERKAAEDAVAKALASPDSGNEPLSVAEAHLLAFQIQRQMGALDLARSELGAALRVTLETRSRVQEPGARASVERLLARIAYFYGDVDGWKRALSRGFENASGQKQLVGMIAIEATSSALLRGDVNAGREALRRAMTAGAEDEDLVYAALWLALSQTPQKAMTDDAVKQALDSAKRSGNWIGSLAVWGLGKIDDATLLSRAHNVVQRTEASFYIAARKRSAGDSTAKEGLQTVASGPAIELVETHLAREMLVNMPANSYGAPPQPLP
jgi:tetratricopeptide (TPR) repeat protein